MSNNYEDELKKRKWQDLKRSVGASVQEGSSMSIEEILLNVKNIRFDSLVSQLDIKTEEDKQGYTNKGYYAAITENELKENFPKVDPSCIFYTSSISNGAIYFNPETLAVCPFHIELYMGGLSKDIEGFYKAIKKREKEVESKEFFGSALTLPDAMRLEYFELLVKTYKDIPNLYHLFFSIYQTSDYGFNSLKTETIQKILNSKTEEEYQTTKKQLVDYPDTFPVYRGGSFDISTPPEQAYSWTININTANFFATRRGVGPAYIACATIPKDKVIEAFLDSPEQEIIIDPKNVNITDVITLKGLEDCENILPEIAPTYHKYKEQMETLKFAKKSSLHGKNHEARVLLHCLTIAYLLDLTSSDIKTLATAAIYHDTQRVHDDIDPNHGAASAAYYRESSKKPDPIVDFLIEYHCLPDNVAYNHIRETRVLSKNRSKTTQLFNIFKDADALDRLRLPGGIHELDITQLREPISKSLTLLARLYLENVEL